MIRVQIVAVYPTAAQARSLEIWLECARRVWNHFLEHRIKAWKRRKERATLYGHCKMLTSWRANDPQMAAIPQRLQRDAIDRLDKAFAGFFRRNKRGEKPGFPRFKRRGRWKSLWFPEQQRYVKNGRISVYTLGRIRCRNLRPIAGKVKEMRLIKRADRWFAYLVIDDGLAPATKRPVKREIGVDVGLSSFATLSTGDRIANPRHFCKAENKFQRSQRRLDRCLRGSKRRARRKLRLAKISWKILEARKDFIHKTSRRLINEFDLIAIEKLNMPKLARGRFAKFVSDAGWGRFRSYLSYKAESAGVTLVEVDPAGTTQECSQCGKVVPKTLADRWHSCPHCGLELNRDHNAAINILKRVPSVGGEFTRVEIATPEPEDNSGRRQSPNREDAQASLPETFTWNSKSPSAL
jgi:putative transposase